MTLDMNKQQSLIIKAFAIIFVIMFHTKVFPCGGAIGVHLFLIVSGYGIYCSLEKGTDNYWGKRISSVYFPYLFCTVIFLILRAILYGNISFVTVIISVLGQDFGLNADPTMWYIAYIFACYLIAWIVFKLKNRPIVAIMFGILAFGTITLFGY
jgi:peptidoglycan/LPS O-acetylase OafA/YrhL